MGVVYAAFDEEAAREVAIKIMMADLVDEPETRARFLREAQAAGCLVHPNIITIFDMGEEEGRIYLVMELLRGRTLAEFLDRPGGVPLARKLDLMTQVCDGLATAHVHGVFHRDIKPGNLFVQDDGTLKILDFGVARLASSTMTASGYIIGTPDYMSPEQARGRGIDRRSDIFSAGAVFYFMLTGRKPFEARDLPAVLRRVQFEDPDPLTEGEAPPPLERVIRRALAKDPAARYPSMGDMLADLVRAQALVSKGAGRIGEPDDEHSRPIAALRAELDELHRWFGSVNAPAAAGDVAGSDGRSRLVAEVARLRAARDAMEAAERALGAGRPSDALPFLETVAGALPGLPRAREALEHCRAALTGARTHDDRRPPERAPAPAARATPDRITEPAAAATGVDDEDTVRQTAPLDPDDTVSLAPPAAVSAVSEAPVPSVMDRLRRLWEPHRRGPVR